MITWIFLGFFIFWLFWNRVTKQEKVENAPLGLPLGSIRALISLMIVAFPFSYLISGDAIPSIIIDTMFVVTAFYFEKRSAKISIKTMIAEIKNPDSVPQLTRMDMPLYFPKYSVRFILIGMILIFSIINMTGDAATFVAKTTVTDLLILVGLFFIGNLLYNISHGFLRRTVKRALKNPKMPEDQLITKLEDDHHASDRVTQGITAIIMFVCVTISLLMFTFGQDPVIGLFFGIELSIRSFLLLLIGAYFGYRQ